MNSAAGPNAPPTPPNVIAIVTDDQGPWAMGCAGNPEIRTPNLDRLAASGTRFRRFFCASPVCSPARASLLTGRIPSAHGVLDWIADGNGGTQRSLEYLAGLTAYTDVLAAHGYTCGISGKWHLGDSPRPQKGFTHWYVHQLGSGPYYNAPMIRDGEPIHESGYVTDRITDDALAYIDTHAAEAGPFYLQVCYTAPHSPWIDNHPQEIVDSYAHCAFASCPQEPRHPWAIWLSDYLGNRAALQGYFAAVTGMDAGVGRILDRLEALDLRQSTLVFFTSDNGFSCGQHGFWGKGNGTFPLNMYENSVTVPTIISQPGRVAAGLVSDALLSHYDWFPTVLDYVGVPTPDAQALPGRSFAPLLRGAHSKGQEYVVAGSDFEQHGGRPVHGEYGPVRMVRTDRWKYVHRFPDGPNELYDLVNDPDERTNLVDHPGRQAAKRELKAELDAWFLRYVDPERDAVREPVTGGGQLDLVHARGAEATGRAVSRFQANRPSGQPIRRQV